MKISDKALEWIIRDVLLGMEELANAAVTADKAIYTAQTAPILPPSINTSPPSAVVLHFPQPKKP